MEGLNQILTRRLVSKPWYKGGSVIAAIAVHLALVTGAFVAPRLFAERPVTEEYVAVTIVPAASLGQIAPPEPKPTPPPEPEPEPVEELPPPEPEAAPQPQPKPVAPLNPRRVTREQPKKIEPRRMETQPPKLIEPQLRQGSPQGNPLATSGPAEISGFDDPDFTYSYYAELMLARIRAVWRRPPISGDIKMTIYFRILNDGHLSDVRIVDSSGYSSFDTAGVRAVQTANMPPLPKSYRKDSLGVRLIIH
ncbi:MAG: TonB family protein [Acidobacteriota bacterium]|nr:TonB family protein [Acidobacteriota bacterium]